MIQRNPKSGFSEVQRRNPFELDLDPDSRALLEELALKYRVSLDPHDPTFMTYVMVRHITARTRDQLKALIDAADEERFQQFEHQRRSLNEDTQRIVKDLKANLAQTFDADQLASAVKDKVSRKIEIELAGLLENHMFNMERHVNAAVEEHKREAHRTNLMWAGAVGVLLITLVACCGGYVRSLIWAADKPSTQGTAQVAACAPPKDTRRAAARQVPLDRDGPPLPPRLRKQRAIPTAVPPRPLGETPYGTDRVDELIDLLPDANAQNREVLKLIRSSKH